MASLRQLLDKLPIDDALLRRIPIPGTSGNVILEIDAARGLTETAPTNPLEILSQRTTPRLWEIICGLRDAAHDDKVVALVVHAAGVSMNMELADELTRAIRRFRESGKPTLAWAEAMGENNSSLTELLIASACEHIWLQPSGLISPVGTSLTSPFFNDALNRIDAKPEFDGRKEYKSAADALTERRFTDADREQYQAILDSGIDAAFEEIAAGRGIELDSARSILDAGFLTPEQAKEIGLIDHIGYRDEAYSWLYERLEDPQRERTTTRYVERYDHSAIRNALQRKRGKRNVALITAHGPIHLGRSNPGPRGHSIGSDDLGAALRHAVNEKVEAVVLRINSGGGSATASDTIRREVMQVREAGIPVIISMGQAAASGGYYISSAGTEIVADPHTLTGSIGVIAGKTSVGKSLERIGVTHDSITRGRHATFLSVFDAFDKDSRQELGRLLDIVYDDFISKVAEGRNMPVDEVEKLARGRVWSGRDAHTHGLVDHLGGLDEAVDRVAFRLGVTRAEIDVTPMPKTGPFDRFFPTDNMDTPVAANASLLGTALAQDLRGVIGSGGETLLSQAVELLGLNSEGLLRASLPQIR
ncbi:Protease 4 [Dermatophilus congolensis]|uniref:Protease 4 n=1 Tax=Dermatophilus congolensis TaxID=1863 RepID=A0AA46H0A9_9MICO|nr:signal peptide peptidase SppA [Dermatophilus congolensis]STD08605.1 Protease 4 [Dermatophilus congolensis]